MLKEIGKYRVEGVLGHGAMGIVYRGVDPMLDRPVAIKTIHAHLLTGELGQQLLYRFKTEATAAAKCQHANIVTVFDFGQHEDTPYIVMEFVKGQSLEDIQRESSGLPIKRINAIVIGMCRGINFAHQQGIVHRDIKPANVMVLEGDAIKIADFGIARMPTSEMTQFGDALGTPSYMSPEQRSGREVDARTDIFSIGVVIYELLSECSDIPDNLRQHPVSAIRGLPASKKLDPEKKFPASIATFFNHCLAADSDKRLRNIGELLEAYKTALQGMSAKAEGTATPAARETGTTGMTVAIKAIVDPDATVVQSGGASAASGVSDPDATVVGGRARPGLAEPVDDDEPAEETNDTDFVRKAIPFLDAMRQLKAIDPVLSPDWATRIERIMQPLDEAAWKRAYTHALAPKNIAWDDASKSFSFGGQPGVRDLARNFVTPQLCDLADKLARTMDELANTRDVIRIADALEGGLVVIDRFDPSENVTRQKEKIRLREAFLYEFAIRVRKLEFDPPNTQRNLSVDEIRTFFVEVFIKSQLLGYWFATLPYHELKKDPNPFIARTIGKEVKTRHLTVVRTDRYYFLIGQVMRFEQNQYSVRRFLLEDSTAGGQFVYFNGVVLNRGQLLQPAMQERKLYETTRIITVQRQLSMQIIELVESFGVTQRKYLQPLLFKPISADGTDLDVAVAKRLQEYEVQASRFALGRLPHGLTESARNQDDYEYLFLGLRAFLIDMLSDIQEFSYQSAAQWSTKTQEMEYRIAAYIRLMEKRKANLFAGDGSGLRGTDPVQDGTKPLDELKKVLDEFEPKLQDLQTQVREAVTPSEDKGGKGLLARMGIGRKKVDVEALQKEMAQERTNCYIALVRVPKKYPRITAYLEFEDLVTVDEKLRHYAFPDGGLGVGKLPVMLELPENRDLFDITKVRRVLEFDVFKQTQSWELES